MFAALFNALSDNLSKKRLFNLICLLAKAFYFYFFIHSLFRCDDEKYGFDRSVVFFFAEANGAVITFNPRNPVFFCEKVAENEIKIIRLLKSSSSCRNLLSKPFLVCMNLSKLVTSYVPAMFQPLFFFFYITKLLVLCVLWFNVISCSNMAEGVRSRWLDFGQVLFLSRLFEKKKATTTSTTW